MPRVFWGYAATIFTELNPEKQTPPRNFLGGGK
jgi:hypothetical protein